MADVKHDRPSVAAHWPTPPGGWSDLGTADDRSAGSWSADGSPAGGRSVEEPSELAPASSPGTASQTGSGGGESADEDGGESADAAGRPADGSADPWSSTGRADIYTAPAPAPAPALGGRHEAERSAAALPARSRPKHLPAIIAVTAGLVIAGLITAGVIATVMTVHRYRHSSAQASVGMDTPVRDGAFQFTADGMRCGIHQIGTADDYQSPTGQFCTVTLTVKNVGREPAIFADAIQKAYAPGGAWFVSDSVAGFYANPDPTIFLNDINPGNEVQVIVVYDIPTTGHIARLEVHENPTTRGAVIRVS